MSMQGCAGASAAAGEILKLLDKLIGEAEATGNNGAVQALSVVRDKAESIKKSADDGWY